MDVDRFFHEDHEGRYILKNEGFYDDKRGFKH